MAKKNNVEPMNMIITVDDGSRRVPIQNTHGDVIGEFTFRPTDMGIVERYNEMVNEFDAITAPLEAIQGEDDQAFIEAEREARRRLCAAVDKLLNSEGASEAFFGRMNPFSPVGGRFYCELALQAIGAYISAQFDAETARFESRLAKYLKK